MSKQNRTLNLLNSNGGDPSMMSSLLYHAIGSRHIPVPAANFVKVVINGENWGVYVNAQQFNKDSLDRIDLSNVSLSDQANKLAKRRFPAETGIGVNEYLVILADGKDAAEGLHANFKLSQKGATLYLSKQEGDAQIAIDTFQFGPSKPGVSIGKVSPASVASVFMERLPASRMERPPAGDLLHHYNRYFG